MLLAIKALIKRFIRYKMVCKGDLLRRQKRCWQKRGYANGIDSSTAKPLVLYFDYDGQRARQQGEVELVA